jgi:hypothetical protein
MTVSVPSSLRAGTRRWHVAVILVVLLGACSIQGDPVEELFADAIAQGDLDVAWELLKPRVLPEEEMPGVAVAMTREHFDATYRNATVTGERDNVGSPEYSWPSGVQYALAIGGPPGDAVIVPNGFRVVVWKATPVRTLVDGFPVSEQSVYTNETHLGPNWMLMSVEVFPGDGHLVSIELADGRRFETQVAPQDAYARFDPELGVAEGQVHM